ncbi:MAG TPA: branched-chain amino acid ABC transporter permease [Acidimicrobiales bacterium]|jgi:branched-chain amino acid transport system permease protein
MRRWRKGWWLAAVAALVAYPLVETNPAYTTIGIFTLIFMACATSWNMFSGYSGYVNLGSAVFYGTGAYTMALFASHLHMAGNGDLFWLVPLGGVVASLVAIPVGLIALRVRRHTFVVITIAIFFVFQLSAINFSFTGGTAGLQLPFIPWFITNFNLPFYYVALGIVFFAALLSALVRRSRFGLQLLAIRDDEDRAAGLGVKVFAVKLTGFSLSAFAVGMGGALYAMFIGQIYPQFVFDPIFDISIALMAIFGGLGTFVGPLLGALVLESTQQLLTLKFSNGSLYLIIFGAVFLVVILFMPQGVVVAIRDAWIRRASRHVEDASVAATLTPGATP